MGAFCTATISPADFSSPASACLSGLPGVSSSVKAFVAHSAIAVDSGVAEHSRMREKKTRASSRDAGSPRPMSATARIARKHG